MIDVPDTYDAIGYISDGNGFPLTSFARPVPQPKDNELLVRVLSSSLNPLEFKLADLNFFGNKPPVALGFDVAGVVIAKGRNVTDFAIGDSVVGMADCDGHGGWATGGQGGYAVVRSYLAAKKPEAVSFQDAGVLPICFLAAYLGLKPHVEGGETIYIPGGAGGVGHLAVQMAARTLGAGLVVSSASTDHNRQIASDCGAYAVIDYKSPDASDQLVDLTKGEGFDIVFDATYSEKSFEQTAHLVRPGGRWVVLGVGPGRTTRTSVTESRVDQILASKGAMNINANVLSFFGEGKLIDGDAQFFLSTGMEASMRWHSEGVVRPLIAKAVNASVDDINSGLQSLREASGGYGKIAVALSSSESSY